MSELPLNSLEIRGYRCFDHLTVKTLGRINLVVGKNNVGKTAFLEALWIYSAAGGDRTLFEINYNRGENLVSPDLIETKEDGSSWALKNLFRNRPEPSQQGSGKQQSVSLDIGEIGSEIKKTHLEFTQMGASPPYTYAGSKYRDNVINSYFVRFGGLRQSQVQGLWNKIELTPLEDAVIETVKIISEDLISIRLFEDKNETSVKTPFARTKLQPVPVELRSLGEGVNRLFEIALAIANCENGILLIDEIESGIHYSVLPNLWKVIFEISKKLNVQVFATTHSKDCVEAFTEAAAESPEDGMLIRLERQGEKIVARTFEEEILIDAVNYEVEVR